MAVNLYLACVLPWIVNTHIRAVYCIDVCESYESTFFRRVSD